MIYYAGSSRTKLAEKIHVGRVKTCMEMLTPNVYTETKIRGCNPSIVFTSEGSVFIDTAQWLSTLLEMRAFAKEEVLPWDHIATGVNKAWLWREKERAEAALVTPDCREGKCSGCGVCQNLDCPNVLQSAWKGSKGANLSD